MKRHRRPGLAALALALALPALAEHGEGRRAAPLLPEFRQECGSCHVPYAPGLLPADSWRRLMADLPRHFGTDASLDAAGTRRIADWLAAHAATGRRAGAVPAGDRITRSGWFVREHREVAASVWKRASVRSAANCAACHAGAEQGGFDEDSVRIPR